MRNLTRRLARLIADAPDRCSRLGTAATLCAGCEAATGTVDEALAVLAGIAGERSQPAPMPLAPHPAPSLSSEEAAALRAHAMASLDAIVARSQIEAQHHPVETDDAEEANL